MRAEEPRVLILMCCNCTRMTQKLAPEINNRFAENVRVLPVTCPSQINPLALIKLLQNSVDGIVVACPKDACCCPENKKVLKRKEIVKDILPVFGLHREQFHLASVSPMDPGKLLETVERMIAFIKMSRPAADGLYFIHPQDEFPDGYKCVN